MQGQSVEGIYPMLHNIFEEFIVHGFYDNPRMSKYDEEQESMV